MNNKLVVFSSTLRPGGAEKIALNLAEELLDLSYPYRVILLLINKSGNYEIPKNPNLKVVDLNSKNSFLAFFPSLFFFIKEKPKYIISVTRSTNIIVGILKFFFNFKLIIREPNLMNEIMSFSFFKKNIFRLLMTISYNNSKTIICNSNDTKKDLIDFLIYSNKKKFNVIHNPVLKNNFYKINHEIFSHKWLINKSLKNLVFCGRLAEQKNIFSLLNIFNELLKKDNSVRLFIIGEGILKNKLIAYSKILNISKHVCFLGYQSNVFSIIKYCKLFILTSKWEGFGNVIVESLSVGTPVISFNCPGGPKEIILNKKYGKLINNFNEDKMVDTILIYLKKKIDRKSLISYSKKFTIKVITKKYLKSFGKL